MVASLPTDRNSFKQFILRRLGQGAVTVNVTDDQVDDCVNYALRKAMDYHFDFAQDTYYKYQITATDIANKWIPLPANVIGVIDIMDLTQVMFGGDIFNAQYQFVLNNIWEWQSGSLVPYVMAMQNLQLIGQVLVGSQPIRFNRYLDDGQGNAQLFVDMDWTRIIAGNFIVVHCYQVVDPDANAKVWSDAWLIEYAAAQLKRLYGENLKKYGQMQLSGGIVFNGQQIYDEAEATIERLEERLMTDYSLPVWNMIGAIAIAINATAILAGVLLGGLHIPLA